MQNPQLLSPLNEILTVKSAARMQCVCKTFKIYIKVKNYSFYRIFKQLDFNPETIIKMFFELDKDFIIQDDFEPFYYPIAHHMYGNYIKNYILDGNFMYIIYDFVDSIHDQGLNNFTNDEILQCACDYILDFFDYKPLQGLMVELCMMEINKL